jgi:hypothetical protein
MVPTWDQDYCGARHSVISARTPNPPSVAAYASVLLGPAVLVDELDAGRFQCRRILIDEFDALAVLACHDTAR